MWKGFYTETRGLVSLPCTENLPGLCLPLFLWALSRQECPLLCIVSLTSPSLLNGWPLDYSTFSWPSLSLEFPSSLFPWELSNSQGSALCGLFPSRPILQDSGYRVAYDSFPNTMVDQIGLCRWPGNCTIIYNDFFLWGNSWSSKHSIDQWPFEHVCPISAQWRVRSLRVVRAKLGTANQGWGSLRAKAQGHICEGAAGLRWAELDRDSQQGKGQGKVSMSIYVDESRVKWTG